ncbi:scaffold protein [Microviridae sp.]|nr:scaffold protein [Microviridae sp.]UOF78483.1 scaffold protein [Microviridae sp.]
MKFRSHFDYDVKEASDEACVFSDEPSLTVQAHAEDADINVLMKRFKVTGQFPESVRLPSYGDFDGISNYQEALHAIMAAEDEFMRLPAAVRAKFDNDPQQLLEFVSAPGNDRALREMGFTEESLREYDERIAGAKGGVTAAAGASGAAAGASGGAAGGN